MFIMLGPRRLGASYEIASEYEYSDADGTCEGALAGDCIAPYV